MQNNQFSNPVAQGSEAERDETLWRIAKKRAAFKVAASSYIIVNCFLVGVWYFTSGPNSYFWPIWSILGWGFGVAMGYVNAYHGTHLFSAQKEYEKLKNNQL